MDFTDLTRDTDPFLPQPEKALSESHAHRNSRYRRACTKIFVSSCILVAFALGYVVSAAIYSAYTGASYETGFSTDFQPATAYIELEQRHFTGSIEFDSEGNEYASTKNHNSRYVGQPNEEIDIAWQNIIQGYHMFISDEEETQLEAAGSYYREDGKGYEIGISMFHSLHCLNLIRMYIDREYYAEVLQYVARLDLRTHIDHCLDFIRQSLQCCGDLTPVPVRWWESSHRIYSDTGLSHSGRKFDMIRGWVRARHNGSLAFAVDEEQNI